MAEALRPLPLPVIRFDPLTAEAAFAVHQTLVKAEIADPTLHQNEHWREQRDIAFARFCAAFEASP